MTDLDPASLREERIAFAESLKEFQDQRSWYSKRAGELKSKAGRLDLLIIVSGALIAALPILKPGSHPHWTAILISFLGAAVVVGQGMQRIYRYGETWPEYRRASERMKREWRAFINAAPPYDAADEAAARQIYIAALEHAIEEEQKLFFDGAGTSKDKS